MVWHERIWWTRNDSVIRTKYHKLLLCSHAWNHNSPKRSSNQKYNKLFRTNIFAHNCHSLFRVSTYHEQVL